ILLSTLWLYLRSGTLLSLFRLRRAPIIAALYPVVILFGQILFAALMGRLAANVISGGLGIAAGVVLFVLLLMLFRRFDRKFFAYYLLHDFAFWAQAGGATPPVLLPLVQRFADQVEAALDGPADEVLVVGHSSGAHLAAVVVAEVLRRRRAENLSLLTLGQAIPVVSFLPKADDLRRDLHQLSVREDLFWLDVTAPGDGACFALCDPVAVSGVAPQKEQHFNPVVISAAFRQSLSPEAYNAHRWNFFRRHIQYLCAFDRPREYDYFRITAGPLSLRERFGARGSSAAREGRVFSPHTSMAP
ncbi:MAG TPA: hypothetical protein VLA51_04200, partial [Paracoccaceae bacterium]|nr:hypothetical protein [Paracoccaceae bacterium]